MLQFIILSKIILIGIFFKEFYSIKFIKIKLQTYMRVEGDCNSTIIDSTKTNFRKAAIYCSAQRYAARSTSYII